VFSSRILWYGGLVFVENIHRRVLLHVMIPVQMLLQLVVRVEGPFNVLDRTDKAKNLVFHQFRIRTSIY